MRYRKLGKTGLDVSVIGFGASPLGNVFGDVSLAASIRTVEAAITEGINLFDVSPYYGLTLAEERLGHALVHHRSQILISTKCGRYGSDTFDFSADTITREFEQSLGRLKTDYVDVLLAHDIEFEDICQILKETIPAMRKLQQQGKARFIGVTSYWPALLSKVATQTEIDCVLNYCHANLFVDDMNMELVPSARQTNIGLLNASPLHMGLLANKPIPDWHPAPPEVRKAALQVRRVCEEYGIDPGTLALRVCLEHPYVSSTLVGLSREEEVTAAIAALNWIPPAGLMLRIEKVIAPVRNLVWPSGLKMNHDAISYAAEGEDATC